MKESLLTDIFWQAGLFLALSALVIPALRYFKVPVSLGYLLAGIMIGPYAIGAFASVFPFLGTLNLDDAEYVKILAELGIVLLLFVIGLELTPRRLWQMRSFVFGLGGAQVIVSAVVIGGIAYLWGNNVQVSVLLGLSLALSSTALVIQWLQEQKLFASHVGRSSFSILLFQDLAVIPILLLLTILSTDMGDNVVSYISMSLVKMVGSVLAIYFIGKLVLKPIFLFANRHGGSEVFMALSLLVIVTSASVASMAGLSMALGAFIAGLLLADTEYRHEISAMIIPFKSMLLGIFFFSFGMSINLSFIAEKPFWILISVAGLMGIKAVIIFALCKLWKQSTAVAAESGILLSQSGEFGLLVVGTALSIGLMEQSVGQFMLITVGMTMLVTPAMALIARKIGRYIESKSHDEQSLPEECSEEMSDHIVIFGFGRVGQMMADNLCHEGFRILGFDSNIERVNEGRDKSAPVYYGDASKVATLKAANLDKALCAVITLDQPEATKKIVKSIRKSNSTIPLVVRAHNSKDMQEFEKYENMDVIAEPDLIGAELFNKVFTRCGIVPNGSQV